MRNDIVNDIHKPEMHTYIGAAVANNVKWDSTDGIVLKIIVKCIDSDSRASLLLAWGDEWMLQRMEKEVFFLNNNVHRQLKEWKTPFLAGLIQLVSKFFLYRDTHIGKCVILLPFLFKIQRWASYIILLETGMEKDLTRCSKLKVDSGNKKQQANKCN